MEYYMYLQYYKQTHELINARCLLLTNRKGFTYKIKFDNNDMLMCQSQSFYFQIPKCLSIQGDWRGYQERSPLAHG